MRGFWCNFNYKKREIKKWENEEKGKSLRDMRAKKSPWIEKKDIFLIVERLISKDLNLFKLKSYFQYFLQTVKYLCKKYSEDLNFKQLISKNLNLFKLKSNFKHLLQTVEYLEPKNSRDSIFRNDWSLRIWTFKVKSQFLIRLLQIIEYL